ncbi:MAG: tetratricopeptide repeat protein [Drouetiella hepatica Uher 2000/2452]|uniref:Tetratricopeptide repeat protein n=1 Tax=Drouetiella hepatica Uher 2000/2452 TaxID=904376 RepID=A0A951QDV9_9CYAN|nr:tetratricopeptide repeat protein [Drouetiella hepatica Uher 2000/2452]
MLQLNWGDTTAFQTLVKGGIAYIGPRVQVNDSQIQILLEQLLARLRPIGIPQNLPRSGASQFVGREADLKQLHTQLQQSDRLAITAIQGMGGIGKTELAWQYAYFQLQQGTYPGGICWLRARDQEIATEITSFAQTKLGLKLPDGLTLAEQVAYCWRQWIPGEVLVIVDDVVDYEAIKASLPPTDSRFRVLLTTRLQLGTSIQTLEIEVLSETASLELLAGLIGTERMVAEGAIAPGLCQWLGYLPLGLELVGRYLVAEPDLSLAKMQQRLEKKRLEAQALCQRSADMTATHESVAAAFALSWQELAEPARQLSYLLSLFALAPIPWDLVEHCLPDWDSEELEKQRRNLVGRSLLQRVGAGTYQLHQLIREFFIAQREPAPAAQASPVTALKHVFCQVMVSVAKQLPASPIQQEIVSITPAIPHVAEVATTLQAWVEDADLLWPYVGLGRFYDEQGAYGQAEPWYEQCLSSVQTRLGQEHPAVASSLNNLASLYESQGRYEAAEPLYVQALEMRQRLLGQEHPDVALSLNNLAHLYSSQGRYEAAEPSYVQALEMRQRLLGQEHPDVARSLNNLAYLYYSQGRYEAAEPLYVQALEMMQRLLGQEHPDVARSLNNLAYLYYSQGRYEAAEPLYVQALEMMQRLLGQEHPDVALSLNNLAVLYYSQGRYEAAEPLYVQALEMRQRLLGAEHPAVATSLNNLAALYRSQGRYEAAEPLYVQALEMSQRLLGQAHPDVAQSLNNLAALYRSQGRYEAAEPLLVQALEMRQRLLGAEHPDVATSLNNLAALYRSQGRYEAAEPLYIQAIALAIQTLGESHPNTTTFRNNFLEMLKQAIQAGQAATLSDDPLTQDLMRQLQAES